MVRIRFNPAMLKVTRRNGSPYYQITGTHCGVRVRESAETTCKKTAELLRTKRERELEQGKLEYKTFADAIEAYLDNGGEERFLDRINEVLGPLPLDSINQEVIDTKAREIYGSYTMKKGGKVYKHKSSTIKRQFYDPVAAVLHYAAEIDWTPYRKVKKPKVTLPPPEWAEKDWFVKLWSVCDKETKAITMFLLFTGARAAECLSLEWKNVDLQNRKAYIPKTKTDAYRTVNLPAPLIEALESIKAERPYVFTYDYHNLRWRLRKACKEAKIPYLSTHKFGSHTFATWLRRYAGADARALMDTGRWASLQMAERYTHTDVSESSKKTDLLGDLFK